MNKKILTKNNNNPPEWCNEDHPRWNDYLNECERKILINYYTKLFKESLVNRDKKVIKWTIKNYGNRLR